MINVVDVCTPNGLVLLGIPEMPKVYEVQPSPMRRHIVCEFNGVCHRIYRSSEVKGMRFHYQCFGRIANFATLDALLRHIVATNGFDPSTYYPS